MIYNKLKVDADDDNDSNVKNIDNGDNIDRDLDDASSLMLIAMMIALNVIMMIPR